jgi:hypothetical protein
MISYLTGPMLGGAKMGIVAERFGVKTQSFPAGFYASSRSPPQRCFCRNLSATTGAKAFTGEKSKKPNAPKSGVRRKENFKKKCRY